MMRTVALLLTFSLMLAAADEWPDFVPPATSGVVNVKDYGATGDGTTDDTAAIRRAIWKNIDRSRYAAPPMIYLPAGTYRLSGPLEGRAEDVKGWSSGWRAGFLLVGQGRGKTVLKLSDACTGYTDPAKPQWVVATGSEADGANNSGGGNRAFRHCIANLTIDVGTGNPGAIALDFIASNRGTVENVRLVAAKDSGFKALAMDRNWPGPALVKHLEVRGFDIAISMDNHWEYSMTFEDIVLSGQRKLGILTKANPVFMRKLAYTGSAPVLDCGDGNGLVTLLDSTITGSGSPTAPALALSGSATIRNLACSGFTTVIDDRTAHNDDVPGKASGVTSIAHWSHAQTEEVATGGQPVWLDLPCEDTPLYWPTADSEWIDGSKDLQAAIDSGKPVVYLPNGSYDIERTIIIRGKVRKIVGFQSSLKIKDGAGPLFRITDTEHPVILEHLWLDGQVVHEGRNALALRHVDLNGGYNATGPGKTFIEDVIGRWRIGPGHHLWARQTNAEFGGEPLLINEGGTAWVLGYKTEGEMTCFKAVGGSTELLGCIFYPLRDPQRSTPAIELSDGARFAGIWRYSGRAYNTNVRMSGSDGQAKDFISNWQRACLWSTAAAAAAQIPAGASTDAGKKPAADLPKH